MSQKYPYFIARDRAWQPAQYTPVYKTSVTRSPRQALVSKMPVLLSAVVLFLMV